LIIATYTESKKPSEVRGALLGIKIWDAVSHLNEGYIVIPIEAKTLYRGQEIKDRWIFTAYLQNGEWYFDYTWVDI
jgi:hypothetical protein